MPPPFGEQNLVSQWDIGFRLARASVLQSLSLHLTELPC
jgi:hypothetical protein